MGERCILGSSVDIRESQETFFETSWRGGVTAMRGGSNLNHRFITLRASNANGWAFAFERGARAFKFSVYELEIMVESVVDEHVVVQCCMQCQRREDEGIG